MCVLVSLLIIIIIFFFTLATHQRLLKIIILFKMFSENFTKVITNMLLMLVLDRFPVPCTEPNDLILNRFLTSKCFVLKFAPLNLSFSW